VTIDDISDGPHSYNFTISSNAGACNIYDSLTKAWQDIASGFDPDPAKIMVTWPDSPNHRCRSDRRTDEDPDLPP
jgi:hypothetical protein